VESKRNQYPSEPVAQYVRQARRIRHVWRSDPAKAQAALQLIAAKVPRGPRPGFATDRSRLVVGHRREDAAAGLAERVGPQLIAGILPWSGRRTLLRYAANHGIGRFEANLIIAASQHRLTRGRPGSHLPVEVISLPRKGRFPAALVTFLVVQALIVATVWHLMF
jgi:hypothetical protein